MASILAWETPWTEEPGGLQSMGSQELDVTQHTHTHMQLGGILSDDLGFRSEQGFKGRG